MTAVPTVSRRALLKAALSASGAVVFYLSGREPAMAAAASAPGAALDGWIRIDADGHVTVLSRTTELGQGALTTLALIVAEELQLEPASVSVEMAPVSERFMDVTSDGTGYYVTWGSWSSRDMDSRMRRVAATVRALLVRAAAQQWSVPEAECHAGSGVVRHADGRAAGYGVLAPLSASLPVPPDVEPRPRSAWRQLGRSTARLDIPGKVDGSAVFGVDVMQPDMLVATIAQCPIFGGTLESVDSRAVEKMAGIRQVVRLQDAIAVVATGYWPARRGLEHLHPVWKEGPVKAADSNLQGEILRRALLAPDPHQYVPAGAKPQDLNAANEAAMSAAVTRLQAVYEVPFLAHAPMEPMNATAHVRSGEAELWVPTQYQSMVQTVAAETLGLPRNSVTVHTTAVGGGFGRRCEIDYAIQAVQIARHFKQPVKLIWSREEDTSRGYFRPRAAVRLEAALDGHGRPTAFSFISACPSIMDYTIERRNGKPIDLIEHYGLANSRDWPYSVGARRISLATTDLAVPVTWMRSVGSVASNFGLECFLDEMAAAAAADPLEYRRRLLSDRPRELAVLNKLAEVSQWQRPAPEGHHRGLAMYSGNGSVVGQVIDLVLDKRAVVRLHRVHCVVDCGVAMNPDAVLAQMEGGIIFGLTGALFGEITIKDGAAQQKNFDTYPLLTLAQTPEIDVTILPSDAPVGGVGEESVPPVAAALANALSSATGRRSRSLPLMRQGLSLGDAI